MTNMTVYTGGTHAGTLTNSHTVGNPAGYLEVYINGTLSYIPFWQ